MNPDLTSIQNSNTNMIPNIGTYPPYTNIPGYNVSNNTSKVNDPPYAESIFSLNRGRRVTVYFSYPDSIEWRDRVFTGEILMDGRDYLLLKTDDGKTLLLWLVYINYAVFDGNIQF
ncbi:MAG: spore coat protein GerQ [Firmicutes bacterium]|nr:spore coat protein GerQ [Bacillota bacterium]